MRTILVANRKGGVGKTLIATTLAAALAVRGARVALADADRQGSALAWHARRPAWAAPVIGLNWQKSGRIGTAPKKLDWLVIDAPGALRGARAEALIGEADALVAPVLASVFDTNATRAFIAAIAEIKRIRRGRVALYLVANRLRAGSRAGAALEEFLAGIGHAPVARIGERAVYSELARDGLSLHDRSTKALEGARAQWQALLDALGA